MQLLRFTGPRPKLPQGMNKGRELLARFKSAKAIKDEADPTLQDAYRWALPQRERFTGSYTALQKKHSHIFDSTAVMEVPKFATRVQMNVTPPWRQYCRLSAGFELPREVREQQAVKIGLADATETLFGFFNSSNLHTQEHEAYQDLSIGTGAIDFWRGNSGQHPFRFDAVPVQELVLEEGPQSTIESTWRCKRIQVQHIQRLYPGAVLSAEHAKLLRDNQGDKKVELIEGTLFDPDTAYYFGVLLDAKKDDATIMWQTLWTTSPRQVFRWSVVAGEIYGRGPVQQLLPDIKTANKVVEFILRHAALQVAGVYTSTADSAINPYTIRITPASVIPVESNSNRDPTIRALERSGDIGLGFEVLAQLQKGIRDGLGSMSMFLDNLERGPVQTATAWDIANSRAIAETGGAYGRLQTELSEPRVKRAVQILAELGRIPPIRVDGRNIGLKYESPLTRAQAREELVDLEVGLEMLTRTGQSAAIPFGYKIDELGAKVAEQTGTDPRIIPSEQERAMLKQQAAQLLQQSQQAA